MYRLIISEKSKDPYGRSLEILGSYNPHTKALEAKSDRIKFWLEKGAGMSPTVNNLLINKKIIEGKVIKPTKPEKKKEEAVATQEETKPEEAPKTENLAETSENKPESETAQA